MNYKYFFRLCGLLSVLQGITFFSVFSQDTIRYYQDNTLVEEIYWGEEDKQPKSAVVPRISFGFQTLSPSVYATRLLSSRFWSIGGQYRRLLSAKANISLGIGIEVAWNNLRWETDDFLFKNQDSIAFVNPNADQVRQNKLGILNLSVPIIIYKNFEKNWRIGFGAYSDLRLQSFSRTAYSRANERFDTKTFSDFHLQNLRLGLQIEAKYKLLRIFAKYDLNSLFKPEKAQQTNLLTFGLGI